MPSHGLVETKGVPFLALRSGLVETSVGVPGLVQPPHPNGHGEAAGEQCGTPQISRDIEVSSHAWWKATWERQCVWESLGRGNA